MDCLSNIQKRNISRNAAIMNKISKLSFTNYFQSIGMKLKTACDPSETYKQFFHVFNSIYDIYFPKIFVRLKAKHIQSPWITKGIAKSSKRKQKLYKKCLKHRTQETELAYKSYKNLFESLKKKAKKNYLNTNAKKTWSIMKELIGKVKLKDTPAAFEKRF